MNNAPNQPQIPEVQGEPLTPIDRFWLETARKVAKESVAALEGAAKQLIAITSLVQGIYFAAISFGNVKKALGQVELAKQWGVVFSLVIPIICWIVSLWFAILVFKPEVYKTNLNSPDLAREMHLQIVAYKHKQLQRAYWALVLGFLPLVINVVLYLVFVPPLE